MNMSNGDEGYINRTAQIMAWGLQQSVSKSKSYFPLYSRLLLSLLGFNPILISDLSCILISLSSWHIAKRLQSLLSQLKNQVPNPNITTNSEKLAQVFMDIQETILNRLASTTADDLGPTEEQNQNITRMVGLIESGDEKEIIATLHDQLEKVRM